MWRKREPKHLFPLGMVVVTPAALTLMQEHGMAVIDFVERHVVGDWGISTEHDAAANSKAVKTGGRIQSVYSIGNLGARVWVITEPDRSATTVLTPDDY
jgi:hypothetical protein